MNEVKKSYSNGEISVVWDSNKCIHSGNCVRSLSSVFQPKSKPWIKMENASSDEIITAVGKCPSGAISIQK